MRPHHEAARYFKHLLYWRKFMQFLVRDARRRGRCCHSKNFIFDNFSYEEDIFIISCATRPIVSWDFRTNSWIRVKLDSRWAIKWAQTSKVRLVSLLSVFVHLLYELASAGTEISCEEKRRRFHRKRKTNEMDLCSALYARITCVLRIASLKLV